MKSKKYSAGMVSKPFWFQEFRKVVHLLAEGYDYPAIRKEAIENNLFDVAKVYRAEEIYRAIVSRTKIMNKDLIELFEEVDLTDQKLINLITTLKTDRLFFEFVHVVFREKIQMGEDSLTIPEIRVFFKNIQEQDEVVAGWKEYTINKLGNSYLNYLESGGLLARYDGKIVLTPPLMDLRLEQYMRENDMIVIFNAITGGR